jgi:hypothetical protein
MAAGIYVLYYESDDYLYYIGKSINIDGRYKDHCKKLKNGSHHNFMLSKGYTSYNTPPTIHVLEYINTIDDDLLSKREIYGISMLDSFNNGMNETLGGEGIGFGEEHPNSIYTKEVYYNILVELSKDYVSIAEVSNNLNVSESVVHAISSGDTHRWLRTEYPEIYLKMKNRKKKLSGSNDLKKRGIVYPNILSPSGEIFSVTNIREFSRIHGLLNQDLGKVLRGDRKSTKGWRLAEII